jgi:hypothetical protein
MVGGTGLRPLPEKVTLMARYNLTDLQSSTLLFATDSVSEMVAIVQDLIRQDGSGALAGLSLSVQNSSGEVMDFDEEDIPSALNMGPAPAKA